MLSIIACIANNNVIGNSGSRGLLWHLPNDFRRFKNITLNKTIIMGYNTFEVMGEALPNRMNVVLSRHERVNIKGPNMRLVHNIGELQEYIDDENEHFVIGGSILYYELMDKVTKLYITRIYHNFDGTAYFPPIKEDEWKEVRREKGMRDEKNDYDYDYIVYERIK